MKGRTSPTLPGRNDAIRLTRRYDAPPQRVFDAWIDPAIAGRWLFATATRPLARAEIDARVRGAFRLVERRLGKDVEHAGEYLEIVPPRRLAFTLRLAERPGPVTRVAVELAACPRGCDLTLTHERLPQEIARRAEARWTGILYGLAAALADLQPAARER